MLKRYSMILWKKPEKREFDVVAKETYQLLMILNTADLKIAPNYQTVRKKEDARLFDWSYTNFYKTLLKQGKSGIEDMGYQISFFSSLIERESCVISVSVGISNPKFTNTLIVDYPLCMNMDECSIKEVEKIFIDCIKVFKPYWGAIIERKNRKRYKGLQKSGIPSTVHWMNYYATPELLRILDKAEDEYTFYKKENFQDGCYFRIKDLPINDDSEEDVKLQSYINHLLGLQ